MSKLKGSSGLVPSEASLLGVQTVTTFCIFTWSSLYLGLSASPLLVRIPIVLG